AVVGSGLMAEKLSGGNEALALLCNASATAAILIVLITMLAPLSGAHLNPAVTCAVWLHGEISTGLSLYYVLAQILGATAGVMIAHFMFDYPLIQAANKLRSGIHQWFSEGFATAGLVMTIVICGRFKPSAVAT